MLGRTKEISAENISLTRRMFPVFGGFLTSTICGMLLYAFSVFIKPINAAFGWSYSDISLAFSICCLSNGLTAFFAGKLTDKFGPKYVVVIGGILTAFGFFMSAYIKQTYHLYITYGLIAGIGSGLIYLPPIVTAPKWWPDKPALATGFVVSGLGMGSFFMGPLASFIILEYGWKYVFIYCGLFMGLIGICAGYLIDNPPKNFYNKFVSKASKSINKYNFAHKEVVKSRQFWLLYLAYFFGAMAGLMVIGHIAAHGRDQGLTVIHASFAVSALAATNTSSRVLSGLIINKIKLRTYFALLFAIQAIVIIFLHPAGKNYITLCLVAAVIGWNYGAMFMLFPTLTLKFFGPKDQGSNYGLLFTSYGMAGFLGPLFGGWVRDCTGTYWLGFLLSSVIVACASLIIWNLKAPSPFSNK